MSRQVIWIIITIVALIFFFGLIIGITTLIIRVVTAPAPVVPTLTPTPIFTITPTPTAAAPSPIPTPIILTPTPIILTPTPIPTIFRTFTGPNFSLSYPSTWGLLTCNNSQNFEFDPINNIDQLSIICGVAQKPITVIVSSSLSSCSGQQIDIGGIPIIRTVISAPNFTLYQWCTRTTPVLKITHRVSLTSFRATSPTNFSPEIEQMISTLRFTTVI